MELENDFLDFIDLLNEYKVEYMIVGGYAVMAHGQPRFTEDFDVWVKPSPENANKVIAALRDFGFNLRGLSAADFEVEDMVVQLGYAPCRIDIMSSISGVAFEEAYSSKVQKTLGDRKIWFIGIRDLIKNKEATGRDQDIVDAKKLKKIILKGK